MYFRRALFKIASGNWNDGDVLLYNLQDMWGTAFGFWVARSLPAVFFDAACMCTIGFEFLMPLLLVSRRYRGTAFLWEPPLTCRSG